MTDDINGTDDIDVITDIDCDRCRCDDKQYWFRQESTCRFLTRRCDDKQLECPQDVQTKGNIVFHETFRRYAVLG